MKLKSLALSAILILITMPARAEEAPMKITSPAFKDHAAIPVKYTCQGDDVSPPLLISDIPQETQTLALINDDPDAPMGTWDHWVLFNIKPTKKIAENAAPGTQGKNTWGRNDYGGPCPPSGTHRYFFKLYALDTVLELPEGVTKLEVEEAMEGHILAQAELVGLYKKS